MTIKTSECRLIGEDTKCRPLRIKVEKRCLLVAPIIHTQGTGYAQPCDSVQTCTPEVGTWRCHTNLFPAVKDLATATQAGGKQGAQHSFVRPAPSTFNASDIKKHPTHFVRGLAWAWGGRGRRFKSGHSDQYVKTAFRYCGEPFF